MVQCFGAIGWATKRASSLYKTDWWDVGMIICLERGADLHMAQLMPLPLIVSCFRKIQIGLPFWYRLTREVLEKGPRKGVRNVPIITLLHEDDFLTQKSVH